MKQNINPNKPGGAILLLHRKIRFSPQPNILVDPRAVSGRILFGGLEAHQVSLMKIKLKTTLNQKTTSIQQYKNLNNKVIARRPVQQVSIATEYHKVI